MKKIINFNEENLNSYYRGDFWGLTIHPNEYIARFYEDKITKYQSLDFYRVKSETKKKELKMYFRALFDGKISIKYNAKHITSYFYLIDLANSFSDNSFLDVDVDFLKSKFMEVIEKTSAPKNSCSIINNFYIELLELSDTREGFNRDLWHLDKLKINKERINEANPYRTLNFRNIVNETNRDYVKLWGRYLIGCTEFAISTVANHIFNVTAFLNEFEDTDASDISADDVDTLIDDWREIRSNKNINKILHSVNLFYKYFEVREESRLKTPVKDKHFIKEDYIPLDNLVDGYVLQQIALNLKYLQPQEKVMFLINLRHGLRISDLCNIKSTDCVYKDSSGNYHLKYSCQKMQKEQDDLICEALYERIKEQQEKVKDKSIWLFPSPTTYSRPMRTGTFSKRINRWLRDCNIKNSDGTDFIYRSHAFRHTVATMLYQDYNLPLYMIQSCMLHHKEQQMSLTYVQRDTEFRKKQHDLYISKTGTKESLNYLSSYDLTKRALSNGFCGNPAILSVCPVADSCLTCEYFRTNEEFLDIHKKHLEEVEKNIKFYEEKGYLPNLETAKETKKALENIINALENENNEEGGTHYVSN